MLEVEGMDELLKRSREGSWEEQQPKDGLQETAQPRVWAKACGPSEHREGPREVCKVS